MRGGRPRTILTSANFSVSSSEQFHHPSWSTGLFGYSGACPKSVVARSFTSGQIWAPLLKQCCSDINNSKLVQGMVQQLRQQAFNFQQVSYSRRTLPSWLLSLLILFLLIFHTYTCLLKWFQKFLVNSFLLSLSSSHKTYPLSGAPSLSRVRFSDGVQIW